MPERSDLALAYGQLQHVWLECIDYRKDPEFGPDFFEKVSYSVDYDIKPEPPVNDESAWYSEARCDVRIEWSGLDDDNY